MCLMGEALGSVFRLRFSSRHSVPNPNRANSTATCFPTNNAVMTVRNTICTTMRIQFSFLLSSTIKCLSQMYNQQLGSTFKLHL